MSTAKNGEISPAKMKILRAVTTLLEDSGSKITVGRIAGQIGVTEAALYRHYRSKEDIFAALLTYMETHLLGPLNHVQKTPDQPAAEQLAYIFSQYMTFLEGHKGLARLLLGQGNTEAVGISTKVQLLNAKVRAQVVQILKWSEAKGTLPMKMTPEQATELFYGQLVAAAMAEVFDLPRLDADQRWKALHSAMFGSIAA